jgi:hypothetical protein
MGRPFVDAAKGRDDAAAAAASGASVVADPSLLLLLPPPLPRLYTAREIFEEADAAEDADAEEEEPGLESSFVTVRSKWALDGADSIDQMVEYLLNSIEYYRRMKREGWELAGRIFDDVGYLVRK